VVLVLLRETPIIIRALAVVVARIKQVVMDRLHGQLIPQQLDTVVEAKAIVK
jgi:hypothetical protein